MWIDPESNVGFRSDRKRTNRLIDGTEPSDNKGPFLRACLLKSQRICVMNPSFLVQLQSWSGILRGSCISCVTAKEIKEEEKKA